LVQAVPQQDDGFTLSNKQNYNIDTNSNNQDTSTGITSKAHFYASLCDVSYQTSGPNRSSIIRVPQKVYDITKNNTDYIIYEKVVDDGNLVVYTPYANTDLTNFSLIQYPTYYALRGSQSMYDFWTDANLLLQQPALNDVNAYDTMVDLYKGKIQDYIAEEANKLGGNREAILIGHSLSGMMVIDIYHQMYAQHHHLFAEDSIYAFNPFIFATPEYLEIREICKNSDNDHYTAYRSAINIYKTKDDFASSLVKVAGVGKVYIYPNVVDSQYFGGINNVAYEAYRTYENHRLRNFSGEGGGNENARYPFGLKEYTTLTTFINDEKAQNRPILIITKKTDTMPNYFDGPDTYHLKVRNHNNSLYADIRAGAGINTVEYEWTVGTIDKTNYYEYSTTLLGNTEYYISPLYTLTNQQLSKTVYFKYTGDASTYNILDSSTGKIWQINQTGFDSKTYPEALITPAITTYIQPGHSPDYLLRGKWQLQDSTDNLQDGLSVKWYEHGPRRLLSIVPPTNFELLLGLGSNTGITNLNVKLVSQGAYYSGTDACDTTERMTTVGSNLLYYVVPINVSPSDWSGIEGLAATAPDDEVFNISCDNSTLIWNITNTQYNTHGRLYYDISTGPHGSGQSYLYELVSNGTSLTGLTSQDFPLQNTNLHVLHNSGTGNNAIYEMYIIHNGERHYLFVQQNSFSYNHSSNYGYLSLIRASLIETKYVNAMKFKIIQPT